MSDKTLEVLEEGIHSLNWCLHKFFGDVASQSLAGAITEDETNRLVQAVTDSMGMLNSTWEEFNRGRNE